jgi:predicted HAD superfamily phosphohydrolase YqeG
MTDTFLANLNGSMSIYCHPLEKSHEKITIKLLRKVENFLLYNYKNRRENIFIKEYLK